MITPAHRPQSLHRPALRLCLASLTFLAAANASATLPLLEVTNSHTLITRSCRVRIQAPTHTPDPNGAIEIGADHLTVEFESGTALRGAAPGTPWDRLTGVGVRIQGHHHVTLRNLHVHGFKNGLAATDADDLVIDGGDYSDNFRQHLLSTATAESATDWLYPHHNEETRWRDEYGGALCIQDSARVTIRGVRIRRAQNGILLDRVRDSAIYDNDASFLSGWGLAFWRSSHNVIARNAFDFCVRGHVEGVYNRGQDSAGILCFEQSSDNLIAENSVTHGGDGFFGFAGNDAIGETWMNQERARLRQATGKKDVDALIQVPPSLARELSSRGCNRNLLIGNDFSDAAAHGIEMTFSRGNQFIRNRMVGNAICGIWGGYSSDTLIADNEFADNGRMAYGLERGAINMEHASNNRILGNRFLNNKCAVHLWWDDDGPLLRYPGVSGNDHGTSGNWIAGNRFEIRPDAPFRMTRSTETLIVVQLRDSDGSHLRDNHYVQNTVLLTHPQGRELDLTEGCTVLTNGPAPSWTLPRPAIPGQTHPVGARKHLGGRSRILMNEWGPREFE